MHCWPPRCSPSWNFMFLQLLSALCWNWPDVSRRWWVVISWFSFYFSFFHLYYTVLRSTSLQWLTRRNMDFAVQTVCSLLLLLYVKLAYMYICAHLHIHTLACVNNIYVFDGVSGVLAASKRSRNFQQILRQSNKLYEHFFIFRFCF